jgi:hypothetical protein
VRKKKKKKEKELNDTKIDLKTKVKNISNWTSHTLFSPEEKNIFRGW